MKVHVVIEGGRLMKNKSITSKLKKKTPKEAIIYSTRLFIKLSDLCRELNMNYRSLFMKQKRLGIFSLKALDKKTGRLVVCFTNKQANELRKLTAPYILKSQIELKPIEDDYKLTRPQMLKVLKKLSINPEKRRRHEENPRSVLVIKKTFEARIRRTIETMYARKK